MSFIKLSADAIQSIKTFFNEKGGTHFLRIDIQSTGCCDPSLGLFLDQPRPGDLVEESQGLHFVISPEVYQTVGEVTVGRVESKSKQGYILTSSKPLSEWEGFGVCEIRVLDKE